MLSQGEHCSALECKVERTVDSTSSTFGSPLDTSAAFRKEKPFTVSQLSLFRNPWPSLTVSKLAHLRKAPDCFAKGQDAACRDCYTKNCPPYRHVALDGRCCWTETIRLLQAHAIRGRATACPAFLLVPCFFWFKGLGLAGGSWQEQIGLSKCMQSPVSAGCAWYMVSLLTSTQLPGL